MMPAANNGAGMNFCFPDVLVSSPPVPPVPLPWPNFAMNAMATPFSPNIYIGFMPALTMASVIPMTSGDEGGAAGGRIKLPGMYTMGNPTIFINCVPAINLLCPATGNAMNAFVGMVAVPSVTVTMFTDAEALDRVASSRPAGAEPPSVSIEAVRWLSEAVHPTVTRPGPPAVKVHLTADLVVLRVRRFVSGTAARFFNALRGREARVRGVVVDLRGCAGGDLDACSDLAGDFLERGATIALRDHPDGDTEAIVARGTDPYPWPMVVLIDRHTASAGEVFAGAMQANRRGRVLGERSYGKASVQVLRPRAEGPGADYVTAATLRLPDGRAFASAGVEPDGPGGLREAGSLLRQQLIADVP